MVSLTEMNVVKIFFFLLLSHEVISYSTQEEAKHNRLECMRHIDVYFEGNDIYEHGRTAIMDYNENLLPRDLNTHSMSYYKSFKNFLRPGNVQPPNIYCIGKSEKCLDWVTKIFGDNEIDAVQSAFYKTRFIDIQDLHRVYENIEPVHQYEMLEYLMLIRDNFDIETIYFRDPAMHCSFLFPLPENVGRGIDLLFRRQLI